MEEIPTIGAALNLDALQTISLTLKGLVGLLSCANQNTGGVFVDNLPFTALGNPNPLNFTTQPLSAGTWKCTMQDFGLNNSFNDAIQLGVRPSITLLTTDLWPPAGQELATFPVLNDTFPLDFNTITTVGSFQIDAIPGLAMVPEPGSFSLIVVALAGLALSRRRMRR